jgi:hypothetical protein
MKPSKIENLLERRIVVNAVAYPRMSPGKYTSYDVLSFVSKILKEDLNRLRMEDWISAWNGEIITDLLVGGKDTITIPECGTVACIGGWINLVATSTPSNLSGYAAIFLLGLDEYSSISILTAKRALISLMTSSDLSREKALEGLDQFLIDYEAILKSITVIVD